MAVESHVAELGDAEEIDTAVTGDGLVQLFLVRGLDQLVDQLRREGVADSVALHRGLGSPGSTPLTTRSPGSGRWLCRAPCVTPCPSWTPC